MEAETEKIADILAMYQTSRQEHVKDHFLQPLYPYHGSDSYSGSIKRWFNCQSSWSSTHQSRGRPSTARTYQPRYV